MKYKTRQKQIILDYIFKNNCVSANDIVLYLKEQKFDVGQTTVYRYLNELTEEGRLVKYQNEIGSSNTYQYVKDDTCKMHIHLKCSKCGRISHIDCNVIMDLDYHIKNDHNFFIDKSKTVIYGRCAECN